MTGAAHCLFVPCVAQVSAEFWPSLMDYHLSSRPTACVSLSPASWSTPLLTLQTRHIGPLLVERLLSIGSLLGIPTSPYSCRRCDDCICAV